MKGLSSSGWDFVSLSFQANNGIIKFVWLEKFFSQGHNIQKTKSHAGGQGLYMGTQDWL